MSKSPKKSLGGLPPASFAKHMAEKALTVFGTLQIQPLVQAGGCRACVS